MWLCKCECGKQKSVLGSSLRSGHTKSCGCLINEWRKNRPRAFSRREINKRYRVRNAEKERLYRLKNSARIVARVREWRKNNPERYKELQAKSQKKNYANRKEKRLSQFREWYARNRTYCVERAVEWGKRNPDRKRDLINASQARGRAELRNSYIKRLILETTGMRASDIPAPLIEAKRVHLKVVRLLKEMQS